MTSNSKLFTPLLGIAAAGLAFGQGGDDCSSATTIGTGTTSFDTTSATTSGFDGGGTCPFGSTTINQDLFYQFTVPSAGDWAVDTFGSSFDTKLSLHAGVGCAATCAGYIDDSGGTLQSEVRLFGLNAGDMILVQVGGFGSNFGSGVLNINPYVDPCSTGTDDSFEDNDTCPTAVTVTPGNYAGLFVSQADSDFYEVSVPAGDLLNVSVLDGLASGATADVELNLYDNTCALITSGTGDSISYSNNTGATQTVIVECFANTFSSDSCSVYDMDVSSMPDPCLQGGDDSLEENDDCPAAVQLGSGTYSGLFVSKTDWDYYTVTVNDGDTLQIDLFFTHSLGDTDIFLYEAGFCEPFANGNVGCSNTLDCGFSASDDEQILWTNTTGSTQTYTVKVNVYPPTLTGDCNIYDMVVSGADGMGGGFGDIYCDPNNPNTTGLPAIITATGSQTAADNDLLLTASQLPDGEFGYFLASRTQGFVAMPNNSQGNLCVLGSIVRFNRPGELGQSAGGELSLQVPMTDVPEPPGPNSVSILAGETWNFQCWHRDFIQGQGATSNFSNAVEITFL